jgi:hypothetical protein
MAKRAALLADVLPRVLSFAGQADLQILAMAPPIQFDEMHT